MKYLRIIGVSLLLVLFTALSGSCSCVETSADENVKPYTIDEYSLKIGRYYQNGDVSKPYVEVFADKTLQWCEADFEQVVRSLQDVTNPDKAAFEEAVKAEAERLSAVHEYTIVDFKNIDTVMIAWDWVEENGAAQGFVYI